MPAIKEREDKKRRESDGCLTLRRMSCIKDVVYLCAPISTFLCDADTASVECVKCQHRVGSAALNTPVLRKQNPAGAGPSLDATGAGTISVGLRETWLSDGVPDAAIQLDGLTVFRADSSAALCVEFVTVRCRPFYLPWEFTTVFIVGLYIPPSANAKEALCELYGAISKLQNAHPNRLFIISGDFNNANLKSVLPKFHQYLDFAMRGVNVLDLVYTNIPSTYRAEPRLHLGYSDHISVMLIPAYRSLVRCSKPVLKLVKTWPEGAISALQDCFECTDWDMFRESAIPQIWRNICHQ
ncbi:hypothetical protein QTP86_002644 [Hemibagrus guttatus]|nr:hypothetical protein QTP86_002644 [Hemibagrus guttatus]